jgi:hypothetical protein
LLAAKHASKITEEGSVIRLLASLLEGILERLLLLRLLAYLLQTLTSLELLERV